MKTHDTIMDTCHLSKHTAHTTLRVNPNVNYRFLNLMMCQCGFLNYNKYVTLVKVFDNRGIYAHVGAGSIWEVCIAS